MSEKIPGQDYIPKEEVAWEMAKAEAPTQETIAVAKDLSLNEDALKELGSEGDEKTEAIRQRYEKAMQDADNIIISALKNGSSTTPVDTESGGLLMEALRYRLTKFDHEKNAMVNKNDKVLFGFANHNTEIYIKYNKQ